MLSYIKNLVVDFKYVALSLLSLLGMAACIVPATQFYHEYAKTSKGDGWLALAILGGAMLSCVAMWFIACTADELKQSISNHCSHRPTKFKAIEENGQVVIIASGEGYGRRRSLQYFPPDEAEAAIEYMVKLRNNHHNSSRNLAEQKREAQRLARVLHSGK